MDYKKQKKFLEQSFLNKKLAHSYILSGPKEVNKMEFILEFVKFVNCTNQKEYSFCGICDNCLKIGQNKFIDLIIVNDLSIDKIKQAKNELIYPPYQADYRIVILNNTEQIRDDAASFLLKTLEEPKKRNLFFLLTNNLFQVLPTIKSRCQILKFNPIPRSRTQKTEFIFKDFFINLKKKTLIEKFSFIKNLKEEEHLNFVEESIIFFHNKIFTGSFKDYSKNEYLIILKNFKKAYFLINKTNTNSRLVLENILLNT